MFWCPNPRGCSGNLKDLYPWSWLTLVAICNVSYYYQKWLPTKSEVLEPQNTLGYHWVSETIYTQNIIRSVSLRDYNNSISVGTNFCHKELRYQIWVSSWLKVQKILIGHTMRWGVSLDIKTSICKNVKTKTATKYHGNSDWPCISMAQGHFPGEYSGVLKLLFFFYEIITKIFFCWLPSLHLKFHAFREIH